MSPPVTHYQYRIRFQIVLTQKQCHSHDSVNSETHCHTLTLCQLCVSFVSSNGKHAVVAKLKRRVTYVCTHVSHTSHTRLTHVSHTSHTRLHTRLTHVLVAILLPRLTHQADTHPASPHPPKPRKPKALHHFLRFTVSLVIFLWFRPVWMSSHRNIVSVGCRYSGMSL